MNKQERDELRNEIAFLQQIEATRESVTLADGLRGWELLIGMLTRQTMAQHDFIKKVPVLMDEYERLRGLLIDLLAVIPNMEYEHFHCSFCDARSIEIDGAWLIHHKDNCVYGQARQAVEDMEATNDE